VVMDGVPNCTGRIHDVAHLLSGFYDTYYLLAQPEIAVEKDVETVQWANVGRT